MTPQEFVTSLFEYEYCSECGGDAEHHTVLEDFPFPGTFFAKCRHERDERSGDLHPTIAEFHHKDSRPS